MGEKHKAEAPENIENRLRHLRTAKGLSQGALAEMAGITRQAIYAIENNQYLPTTAVALRLAAALGCRVEDLFSLISTGENIEGEWLGERPSGQAASEPIRVKVARIGTRVLVRPVASLGELLNFTVAADGLLIPDAKRSARAARTPASVRVRLLKDRKSVESEIVVAGCDPAMFLVGEYLRRRKGDASLVEWTMGSAAAVDALKQGEVHVAGLHLMDARSGESNLPYLRQHLRGREISVVTFASWEQGLMVRAGNPKGIRGIADLARKDVRLINREKGAGARALLDHRLTSLGIKPAQVQGYDRLAASHLDVARAIGTGLADAGIGVRSAARLLGLQFLPLQEERYDLVMPTAFLKTHPALDSLLDTIVSRPFRTEVEALGGYDTAQTGRLVELAGRPSRPR